MIAATPTLHAPAAKTPHLPVEMGPVASGCLVLALLVLAACDRSDGRAAESPPPKVGVATVIYKPVAQWDEFTGRVAAVDTVELRPRVGGYIDKVNFSEGQEVAKGDVLFVIDPRNYQAEVDRAKAELGRAGSRVELARSEAERARKLAEAQVISTEMYDQRAAAAKQAGSDILAAKAQLEIAQLNLGYTQVRAPISGRAGRALVTVGNLALPNETVLTTLVSLDPAYVYFEGDEGTYLRYAAQVRSGEQASPRTAHTPVRVGLANEEGYPHSGFVDFVDNQLDQGTGTIRARAVVDNKARVFTPGLFARVQMLGGAAKPTVLIDDKAVLTDQDRKYVYVIDRNNAAERRDIVLGRNHDRLRVVSTGLKPGDRIVVNGVQKVFFPGMKVDPTEIEMGAPAPDPAKAK